MKKVLCAVLFVLLACGQANAGSGISYPLNSTPQRTDQVLGIDDPSGTWSFNRITIEGILSLIDEDDLPGTYLDSSILSTNTVLANLGAGPVELPIQFNISSEPTSTYLLDAGAIWDLFQTGAPGGVDTTPTDTVPSTPVTGRKYSVVNGTGTDWTGYQVVGTSPYWVTYTGSFYLIYPEKLDGTPAVLEAAPTNPVSSWLYWQDHVNWLTDSSISSSDPVLMRYNGSGYLSIMLWNGTILYSRNPLSEVIYSATATISASHMYGTRLSNWSQTLDATLTMPLPATGMNALFDFDDVSDDVLFEPYSGEQFLFESANGTKTLLSADQGISCTGMQIGDELRFVTYRYGASVWRYKVTQISGDSCTAE